MNVYKAVMFLAFLLMGALHLSLDGSEVAGWACLILANMYSLSLGRSN